MSNNDQSNLLSPFFVNKYKLEAKKNWDLFYKRNKTNFYKDRNWLSKEFKILFDDLTSCTIDEDSSVKLIEIGCGVGNTVFPLINSFPNLYIFACDHSKVAVDLLKEDSRYNPEKINAFQLDITNQSILEKTECKEIDYATLIFVLSAIPVEKIDQAIQNIYLSLKANGTLFVRDYAYNDAAQNRFSASRKIDEQSFVRQDGTFSYFFKLDEMKQMFEKQGFKAKELAFVNKTTTNNAKNITLPRKFIQAIFVKE